MNRVERVSVVELIMNRWAGEGGEGKVGGWTWSIKGHERGEGKEEVQSREKGGSGARGGGAEGAEEG